MFDEEVKKQCVIEVLVSSQKKYNLGSKIK